MRRLLLPDEVSHLGLKARRHFGYHQSYTADIGCVVHEQGIEYVADPKRSDVWCSPGATLQKGSGDCDDYAILAAAVGLEAGIPSYVVIGKSPGAYHAWNLMLDPRAGVMLLEPQNGKTWHGLQRPGHEPQYVFGTDGCWSWRGFVAALRRSSWTSRGPAFY